MKNLDDVLWVRAFAHGQEMGVMIAHPDRLEAPDAASFQEGFLIGFLEAMRNVQAFIDMNTIHPDDN